MNINKVIFNLRKVKVLLEPFLKAYQKSNQKKATHVLLQISCCLDYSVKAFEEFMALTAQVLAALEVEKVSLLTDANQAKSDLATAKQQIQVLQTQLDSVNQMFDSTDQAAVQKEAIRLGLIPDPNVNPVNPPAANAVPTQG